MGRQTRVDVCRRPEIARHKDWSRPVKVIASRYEGFGPGFLSSDSARRLRKPDFFSVRPRRHSDNGQSQGRWAVEVRGVAQLESFQVSRLTSFWTSSDPGPAAVFRG